MVENGGGPGGHQPEEEGDIYRGKETFMKRKIWGDGMELQERDNSERQGARWTSTGGRRKYGGERVGTEIDMEKERCMDTLKGWEENCMR